MKQKNVRDELKHLSQEDLTKVTNTKRNDFSILMQNLRSDANIGTVVRTSNAFLAKEVIYYGCKKFNKSVAVGTHHRENLRFFYDKQKLFRYIKERGFSVVCAEITPNAKSIVDFQYPPNTLIVLGHEGDGIYDSLLKIADHTVYIPQIGPVRSLNVGVTGSLFMFDWMSKALKAGKVTEDALLKAAEVM